MYYALSRYARLHQEHLFASIDTQGYLVVVILLATSRLAFGTPLILRVRPKEPLYLDMEERVSFLNFLSLLKSLNGGIIKC